MDPRRKYRPRLIYWSLCIKSEDDYFGLSLKKWRKYAGPVAYFTTDKLFWQVSGLKYFLPIERYQKFMNRV